MKRIILFMLVILSIIPGYAQDDDKEKSRPSFDTEIVRRCSFLNIEGKSYSDVVVTLKSISPYNNNNLTDKYKVKVKVTDENGKKIYKKTFSNSYLYIFSNGQIQVGKPKFNQILIQKALTSWFGEINEKEGVW